MIQYQVIGNYKHTKNVRISTEKTLQDAYETIYFVGHPIDEWRERQAEERREKDEALMGTPCLGCYYADKCDYAYSYQDCELCEYDEQEEAWERMD